ncbi:DUF3829 domain-containing protein [Hyphomicrobium sp. LHD-15]|uniref:DUF3829 domain-containing protein n=1 Tax=Hyphomicrobium sp. LHD-15 TaxID=3072142 RepID=UPI00280FDFB4|nr:DUF3829 domain-containing protein [Hyphomicrobium sp. LHD-15]MDQ8698312.1 DUF3829 domain-containing protein [Hyphomicrobium sp. LHD-15]
MRASRIGLTLPALPGLTRTLILVAGSAGALSAPVQSASAQDVQAALEKANAYIEVAKNTERAVESWDRYASWVNMKIGPTGKERYISYGMYDLSDLDGALKEARAAAGKEPSTPKLDAAMTRYIDAYEALAPLMNRASAYYDREDYKDDKVVEGQALHKQLVPLATTFLAERDAMMPELRAFARDVEQQEVAAREKQQGRTAAWHAGNVLHHANRVIDLFPRQRPQPIDSDTLDEMITNLGPNSSGEAFDQIISGVVPPKDAVIDVTRYGEALEHYAKAVEAFDGFSGESPEEFDELKPLPRKLLVLLQDFYGPLKQSGGHEFEGGGHKVVQITEVYFELFNEGNGIWGSQLRFLP